MLALGEQMRGLPSMGAEPPKIDLSHDVFMGHEFAAEVLEVGKDTEALAPGTLVTSIPVLLSMTGIDPIVYSNTTLGRLRRADAPLGPAPARGPERPRSAPRRARPNRWPSASTR